MMKLIDMSKQIELAKKIKALVDRGVGGEKENAEKLLADFLKKHNLTIEEIEGEAINEYFFKVDKEDVRLWRQIVANVNYEIPKYGEFPKKVQKNPYILGNFMVKCTAAEFVEIESKFNFYKKLYKQELEIFYSAFIHANRLYSGKPANESQELSDDELEQQLRIVQMAQRVKKGEFNKQIN